MTDYLPREMGATLLSALEDMPVVVLTGMRQTGKSTLLKEEPGLTGRRYVTLDDFAQLEAARSDPDGFLAGNSPLSIDEAQRCPELLVAIKRQVDRDRRSGRFLLSGSANFALLKGISESLAGRALYLTLHPLTRRERNLGLESEPALVRFYREGQWDMRPAEPVTEGEVLLGGLPPVALGQVKHPRTWFTGFEQTYLERDLRQLSQVADLMSFRRVLKLCALWTGRILNQSSLARDAQLSAATTGRYLSLLETSFVMERLPPFLGNRASRLIKSPKVFVTDSGLAAHLAGVEIADAVEPLRGALFETYFVQNLASLVSTRWPGARLAFWHVQGRHEVDVIVEVGTQTLAIEIKTTSRWGDRDLTGLRAFQQASPRCRAAILAYNGTQTVKLGDRLWAVPMSRVLQ